MGAFEENVDKACKELVIPGAVMIASTADGHFRYEKAFGVSSLKSNAPMKLDATMWIASCTKLVTTVAALQCVERGQLKLDDDVVSILPELKDRPILKGFDKKTGEPILVPNSKIITLRHLLTHSSGLSYDVFSPKLQKYRAYQKRKFGMKETFGRRNVAEANDFPLVFAPGEAWEYSVGIDFAGEMVARVNKTTLEEYFKKNIWGPLDAKNITFFPKASPEVMARLADMSEREGGLTMLGTAADPNGKVKYTEKTIWSLNTKHCFGGAGLYGSPLEYHKILQSICANDERLLKRSSVAEMFKPQLTDAARERLEFFLSIPDMNQGMGGLPEERKVDWGLGGLLNLTASLGRSAGSMTWGGYPNLTWWIDPVGGVSGMFGTQIYPQGDLKAVEICNEFSTEHGNEQLVQSPSLNISKSRTFLSRTDPLKRMFKSIFDVLPQHSRGHVVAGIGEFIGTIFFLFMAFAGAQVAFITSNDTSKGGIDTQLKSPTPQAVLYISLSAGFALVVTAWTFYRISGGLFNPAVSLGMVLIGALTIARGVLLCVVQTVGAIVAAYMVSAIFPGELNVGTALHPEVSVAQGVLIEMLLTSQLVFIIFMLAAEKHEASFLAPVGIGLSLFIAEMIGVFWTGGSLNPARSLAPAIVTRTFPTEHWIYWVGPTAGSLLAVLLYKLIKALEYESANSEEQEPPQILPITTKETMSERAASAVSLKSVKIGDGPSTVPIVDKEKSTPPLARERRPESSGLPECTGD